MEAGMGPVCLSRTRFIESIGEDQLSSFEGKRKSISESHEFKTGILRTPDSPSLKYVTLLKKDGEHFVFIDRKKYSNLYDSGLSVTEALMASLGEARVDPQATIATVSEPKEDELIQKFKGFVGKYKEELQSREKEFYEFGFSSVVGNKGLPVEQKENRKEFIKNYKTKYSPEFKEKWSSGEYSISTIIARLNSSKIPGAKDLAAALKKKHNVSAKDYGLTDEEISLGLQQATLPLERKIFSAIIKGEGKLVELSRAYSDLITSPNKDLFFEFYSITG